MKFCMPKISGLQTTDGRRKYEAMIMKHGASTPCKQNFARRCQMKAIVNNILAQQKRDLDVRRFLRTFEGEHYFYGVEITEEQAKSLGWTEPEEIPP